MNLKAMKLPEENGCLGIGNIRGPCFLSGGGGLGRRGMPYGGNVHPKEVNRRGWILSLNDVSKLYDSSSFQLK